MGLKPTDTLLSLRSFRREVIIFDRTTIRASVAVALASVTMYFVADWWLPGVDDYEVALKATAALLMFMAFVLFGSRARLVIWLTKKRYRFLPPFRVKLRRGDTSEISFEVAEREEYVDEEPVTVYRVHCQGPNLGSVLFLERYESRVEAEELVDRIKEALRA